MYIGRTESEMSLEEAPNRDSERHIGPREGNSVQFTSVEDRGDRREADRRQAEQTERYYTKPVDSSRCLKRRAVDATSDEDTPRQTARSGPSTFKKTYYLKDSITFLMPGNICFLHIAYVPHRHRHRKSGGQCRVGNKPAYQLQRPFLGTSVWPLAIIEDVCDRYSAITHRR